MNITFVYTATHSPIDAVDVSDSVTFTTPIVSAAPKKTTHRAKQYGLSRRKYVDRVHAVVRNWQIQSPKASYDVVGAPYKQSEYWCMMLDSLDNGGQVLVSGLPGVTDGTAMRLVDGYKESIVDKINVRFNYTFDLEYVE